MVDISIYDENHKMHVIKDVVLSETDSIVHVPFEGKVSAIIPNHGDFAYLIVFFDQMSLCYFE